MKTEKVLIVMKEIVELLEQPELRIDEKIAACRAAADLFQQIMSTESTILAMQKVMENALKH